MTLAAPKSVLIVDDNASLNVERNPMDLVEVKGISKRKKRPQVLQVKDAWQILDALGSLALDSTVGSLPSSHCLYRWHPVAVGDLVPSLGRLRQPPESPRRTPHIRASGVHGICSLTRKIGEHTKFGVRCMFIAFSSR